MRITVLFSLIACLIPANCLYADASPYWVFFKDRGAVNVAREVSAKIVAADEPKNTGRRAKILGSRIFDERDLPVNPGYIATVAKISGSIRTVTRYFNGVSVDLDAGALTRVESLPFVQSVRPVESFRAPEKPAPALPSIKKTPSGREKPAELSYGNSFEQINLINVIPLHNKGYLGDGIRIGILDSGFDNLGHAAFDSIRISHRWDFVGKDGDVGGDDHGAQVLSVMAALDRGNMIGAAPHATFLLARTEIINEVDTRIEEDYWVAGLEWADSLGVDVVQSSLGYTDFSDGKSYSYSDMNGQTAVTTIAADIAVEKGIVVVNAAGNEGNQPWYYVTAPADGKKVIAVGSVNRDGRVSAFSSRGPTFDGRVKPDFMAMGEQVEVINGIGDSYLSLRGTSFASPAVSGAAALLLQIHQDWTPAVLYDSLRVYARRAAPDTLYGHGILDAFAASGLKSAGPAAAQFKMYDPYPQPAVFSKDNRRLLYFPVDIPVSGKTLSIRIFNFIGENIKTIEKPMPAGGSFRGLTDAPSWDGTNFTGDAVAPGIYFYSIRLAGYSGYHGKIAVMR
ncbi:MAG: S8 family serine peptidase [Candidatus Latescibacter sp.]|nr:S8 family serine peptidase [Candidatus Latescibacter sp.]